MTPARMEGPLDKIRTDVVGSLLRPARLRHAREQFGKGLLDIEGLRKVEDDVVTDGEFRRLNFQDSFGQAVSGFDSAPASLAFYEDAAAGARPQQRWDIFAHQQGKGPPIVQRQPVIERLRMVRNVPLDEYVFAHSIAHSPVKVSLIGPDRIAQRYDHQASTAVYRSIDEFLGDVVRIEREMIKGLVDAGCRYVHIDAPGYTAYVDEPSLAKMRERGENPMENLERSIEADNAVIEGFKDVTFGIHLCRGNQRGMWHREGHYDGIAERLFTGLKHQRFLLEYDTPRAGGFAPLRFVPWDRIVVLGLISTKAQEMETVAGLQRRIDAATEYLPLEQLAISPQCGFASEFTGNPITEDIQRRKLELVVETARSVWG
jgi:5-methyltetrahydropteroyltriglutamate--homocysteine methyltransferase